jgi:hypothetical protein
MAINRSKLGKTTDKKQNKVSKVMREFKKGKLNIGKSKKKWDNTSKKTKIIGAAVIVIIIIAIIA